MKRQRRLIRAQGWIEATRNQLGAIRDSIVSDQAENVVAAEGRIRVHRLPPFPPKPEVERANVSGDLEVRPIGGVRRK